MAGLLQRTPDRANAAIHHVGRGQNITARLNLRQALLDQQIDSGVIEDDAVLHHPVMAMIGKGVERYIADYAHFRRSILHRLDRPHDEAIAIERFGTGIVLQGRVDMRKYGNRGDAEVTRTLRGFRRFGDAHAHRAGHGLDRLDRIGAV